MKSRAAASSASAGSSVEKSELSLAGVSPPTACMGIRQQMHCHFNRSDSAQRNCSHASASESLPLRSGRAAVQGIVTM
jgi:hypothetical protein